MIERSFALTCPGCGSQYMHQNTTRIFNRTMEDTNDGVYASFDTGSGGSDFSVIKGNGVIPEGNPSPRRQGLSVSFDCEQCHLNPTLYIAQHKGVTFIEWAHDGDTPVELEEYRG